MRDRPVAHIERNIMCIIHFINTVKIEISIPHWYYDYEWMEEMLHAELYTYTSYVVTVVIHNRAKYYPSLVL